MKNELWQRLIKTS